MESVFGRTLLVFGPESVTADRVVKSRVAIAQAERPDSHSYVLDGAEVDEGRLAEVSGGSLLADSSVVVIRNAAEVAAASVAAVLELASQPFPDLCLIIVHPGGVRGRGLLDKLKKLTIERVECPLIKTWDLPNFATSEARFAGGKIERQAAMSLVEALGNDTNAIAGAVKQLMSDTKDGFIRDDQVRRYFSGRADVSGFAIADDIMVGHTTSALEKARWMLSTGASPAAITAATASALRQLGKYFDLRSAGLRDADLAREIGVPVWKVKDVARASRSWKSDQVASALIAVSTADAEVKGAGVAPGYAIDKMILAVARARRSTD